jgi:lipopolysaccharide transport system permease protein
MVVFTLFFGRLAKIPSDGIPYPIFNYTVMVAWTYFATSITGSSNSLTGNTNLISKVYFPRLIIPLSPVLAGLLDFFIAFVVLIGMMLSNSHDFIDAVSGYINDVNVKWHRHVSISPECQV